MAHYSGAVIKILQKFSAFKKKVMYLGGGGKLEEI